MAGLQIFDIIVIALVIIMAFRGGMTGIIMQIASIFSIGLGWYVSDNYYPSLEPLVNQLGTLSKPVSIVILFVGTIIAVKLVARIIRGFFAATPLKEFDRQMGALLGLVKGIILCMILTYFAVVGNVQSRNAVFASQSGKYFIQGLQILEETMPDNVQHKFLKDGLAQFNALVKDANIIDDQESDADDVVNEVDALKKKLEKDLLSGSDLMSNIKNWSNGNGSKSNDSPSSGSNTQQGTQPPASRSGSSGTSSNGANSLFDEITNWFGSSRSGGTSSTGSTSTGSSSTVSSSTGSTSTGSSSTVSSSTGSTSTVSSAKPTFATAPDSTASRTSSMKDAKDLSYQMALDFQNTSQSQAKTQAKNPFGTMPDLTVPNNTVSPGNRSYSPTSNRAYTSSILDQPVLPPNQDAPKF